MTPEEAQKRLMEIRKDAIASVAWAEATEPEAARAIQTELGTTPLDDAAKKLWLSPRAIEILEQVAALRDEYRKEVRDIK